MGTEYGRTEAIASTHIVPEGHSNQLMTIETLSSLQTIGNTLSIEKVVTTAGINWIIEDPDKRGFNISPIGEDKIGTYTITFENYDTNSSRDPKVSLKTDTFNLQVNPRAPKLSIDPTEKTYYIEVAQYESYIVTEGSRTPSVIEAIVDEILQPFVTISTSNDGTTTTVFF